MFELGGISDRAFRNTKSIRKVIRSRAEDEHLESQDNTEMYHRAPIHNHQKQGIEIYSDLDKLVERCKFDEKNLQILKFIWQGYSYRAISGKLNIDNSNISKRLNTICRNIMKEYELQILKEEAKNTNAYFKKCTKCGENLPVLSEFFSYDKTNQCYKSSCKKCRRG